MPLVLQMYQVYTFFLVPAGVFGQRGWSFLGVGISAPFCGYQTLGPAEHELYPKTPSAPFLYWRFEPMPKLAISSPRTRVIHFRINEQEYDVLCSACRIDGDQNLSEFARSATIDVACSLVTGKGGLRSQLNAFGQKLSRVDSASLSW